MSETVWTLMCGYRPGSLGYEQRTARLVRRIQQMPGFFGMIWMERTGRLNWVMFSTEEHARKAQEALMYHFLRMPWGGRFLIRSRVSVGMFVFRGELDEQAGELRVMEPADGWDAVLEDLRLDGMPWPPADGLTDVIRLMTDE